MWRGLSKEDEGATAFTPDFMPRVLKYLDQTWCFYRDVLGFPMPWSDKEHQANDWKNDPVHHKVNVFLTHTGLAHHKSGWANGARGIQIHPNAFGDGSSVLPHEAGHVMQLYSGRRGECLVSFLKFPVSIFDGISTKLQFLDLRLGF